VNAVIAAGTYRYSPMWMALDHIAALEDADPERRAMRIALATALVAIDWNAEMGGDGYSEEDIAAIHAAAPLLGIDLVMEVEEPGTTIFEGDAIYRMRPRPQDVLAALLEAA
jgi:hypothetical protein